MQSRLSPTCSTPRPLVVSCALALLLLGAGLSPATADEPASAVGPLMKLFQSGRLPAERQGAVVEMICNRGNEHDLRVIFDRVTQPQGFSADVRLKAMGWLTDAAVNRKVQPAGDLAPIETLVTVEANAQNRALQLAAIRLASTWKVAAISPRLQTLATDPKTPPQLQQAAIDGLVAIGDPASRATIQKLTARTLPMPVRLRAITGLVAFDVSAAAQAAASAIVDSTPQDEIGPVLDAFFNRKDGPDALAAALEKQPLPADAAKLALRYMYSVGRSDGPLSAVLSTAAGVAVDPPPPTPEELALLVQEVLAKGDPARGEKIFRRADLSCMKCHSVSRAGGQVGPDLSAVGGSSPVDYIVNSILNPSLAVKEQYVTKIFAMVNGQVFNGIVVDRDDVKIRLRDAAGKTIVLPTADVDEEVEGQSLMPQGLTKFLTRDELLDLARFISELGKPGPYEIRKTPTVQRWRLLKKMVPELIDDVPHLEHMRQYVFGSAPEDWAPAYGKVNGVLPLEELRTGTTPTVLILQGEIDVNEAGPIRIQISSTEKTQLWIDTDPFDTRQQVELPLNPGRHKITVRVEVSDRPAPELKIELTKPEDSPAQFEVLSGA